MKIAERMNLIVALLSAFLVASCATMVKGTSQRISISSDPPGANITLDSMPAGETPTSVELSCASQHTVKIEKAGYLPQEQTISQTTSGWLAGNIIAGGLIGVCIDAATGGMYRLTPESISATLVKAGPPASPEAINQSPPASGPAAGTPVPSTPTVSATTSGPQASSAAAAQVPVAAEAATHP